MSAVLLYLPLTRANKSGWMCSLLILPRRYGLQIESPHSWTRPGLVHIRATTHCFLFSRSFWNVELLIRLPLCSHWTVRPVHLKQNTPRCCFLSKLSFGSFDSQRVFCWRIPLRAACGNPQSAGLLSVLVQFPLFAGSQHKVSLPCV